MSKHVTIAVVGAGMAGQAHTFGYRNATMHPDLAGVDVRLAAVVDFNADLAASAAARYGFAAATTDLDAVLGDDGIERGQPRAAELRLRRRDPPAHRGRQARAGRKAARPVRRRGVPVRGRGGRRRPDPRRRVLVPATARDRGDRAGRTSGGRSATCGTPPPGTSPTTPPRRPRPCPGATTRSRRAAARSWTSARTSSASWSTSPGRSAAWSPRTPGSSSRERPVPSGAVVGHGPVQGTGELGRSPLTMSPRRSSN